MDSNWSASLLMKTYCQNVRRPTQRGYDLKVAETVSLEPGEIKLVPTGVKAYMQANEVLYLYDRSSNPRKKGLVLINSVGVIDGDYYGNPANEGHIFAQMRNITEETVVVEAGERIVQAVLHPSSWLTVTRPTAFGRAALAQRVNRLLCRFSLYGIPILTTVCLTSMTTLGCTQVLDGIWLP